MEAIGDPITPGSRRIEARSGSVFNVELAAQRVDGLDIRRGDFVVHTDR